MQLARNIVATVLLGFVLIGCANVDERTESFPRKAERDRIWQSMNTVLSRHFNVRRDRYLTNEPTGNSTTGDAIVGYSKIHSDGFNKYRLKVVGRIFLDDEDYYQAHVRVLRQYDVSMAHTMSRASAQPRYQWRNGSFDQTMEAQLRNEIDREFHGRSNPYDGRFHRNELPKDKGGNGAPDLDPASD